MKFLGLDPSILTNLFVDFSYMFILNFVSRIIDDGDGYVKLDLADYIVEEKLVFMNNSIQIHRMIITRRSLQM